MPTHEEVLAQQEATRQRRESAARRTEHLELAHTVAERAEQIPERIHAAGERLGVQQGHTLPRLAHGAGVIGSGIQVAQGVDEFRRGDRIGGGAHVAGGALGATENVLNLMHRTHAAERVGGAGSIVSGGAEAIQAVRDIHRHGADGNNINSALHGTLDAASGVATVAGAAPAAAVLGAGAAGVAIGQRMVGVSDAYGQRTGRYGVGRDGHNRTGIDAAADAGISTAQNDRRNHHGETYANVHGAASAVGHGLVNVASDNANAAADAALRHMGMGPRPPEQTDAQRAAATAATSQQLYGHNGQRDPMNVNPLQNPRRGGMDFVPLSQMRDPSQVGVEIRLDP